MEDSGTNDGKKGNSMTTTDLIRNSALFLRAIEGVPLLLLAAIFLAITVYIRHEPLI